MIASNRRPYRESFVRWRDDGFEYRCSACGEWWPLTMEFWRPCGGMRRCKSCQLDGMREARDPLQKARNDRRRWREREMRRRAA